MTILAPHDPVPDKTLLFRIDLRADTIVERTFWHRVRKGYLPRFCGQVFWVSSNGHLPSHVVGTRVTLPRDLMLQYLPVFCRLSSQQSYVFYTHYILKNKLKEPGTLARLSTLGLVRSGRITTLGWNSYHLSP